MGELEVWRDRDVELDSYHDDFDFAGDYLEGLEFEYEELTPESFYWTTAEGEVLTLEEMTTRHIFNAMKMIFNHLAAQHGGNPVWFTVQHGLYKRGAAERPDALAALVVFFIEEIDRRGDLPARYEEPFASIVSQVVPAQLFLPKTRR